MIKIKIILLIACLNTLHNCKQKKLQWHKFVLENKINALYKEDSAQFINKKFEENKNEKRLDESLWLNENVSKYITNPNLKIDPQSLLHYL